MGNKISKHMYECMNSPTSSDDAGFEFQENENHVYPHMLVQIHGRDLPLLWEPDPNSLEPVIHPPMAPLRDDNVALPYQQHKPNHNSSSCETDAEYVSCDDGDEDGIYHPQDHDCMVSQINQYMNHQGNDSSTTRETDSDGGEDDSDETGDENHPQALVQIQSPKNPKPITHPPTAPVSNVNGGRFQEDAQMVNQQSVHCDKNHVAMVNSPVTEIHDQLPLQESEAQLVGVNPDIMVHDPADVISDLEMELGGVIVLDDENVQDEDLVMTVETTPAIVDEL